MAFVLKSQICGVLCTHTCTYFSVLIFRSLVDLGTALSNRSSVVILDILNFFQYSADPRVYLIFLKCCW